MKKYFLAAFIAFISVSTASYAAGTDYPIIPFPCKNLGYTEGADCDLNGSFVDVVNYCYVESSPGGHTCVFKSCGDKCMCVTDNKCPGETEEVTCSGTPTWPSNVLSGKQTGSCKGTNGSTLTVYRCTDGYHSSLTAISKEYSYTDITCTKCPQHEDDKSTYAFGSIPKYITTNGAGANSAFNCTIKANTDITDTTGTFQYDSACKYSPLEILG